MATGKALDGMPYAGKLHARFEEGASAREEPRRKALLHRKKLPENHVVFVAVAASLAMCATCAAALGPGAFASTPAAVSRHCITSGSPAEDSITGWERESYPIGNGWFGASVFGGVPDERLQITENSFLTRRNLTSALDIRTRFLGDGHSTSNATDYVREVEFDTGIARVAYSCGGVKFRREIFASYPDRVLAVKYAASEKGSLSFDLKLEIPYTHEFGVGTKAYKGRAGRVAASGRSIEAIQHLQYYNVKFFGFLTLETDGEVVARGDTLEVRGANEATAFFSCGTNYRITPESFVVSDPYCVYGPRGYVVRDARTAKKSEIENPDPAVAERVRASVSAAAAKGYEALRTRHVADFSGLMGRAAVRLPDATDVERLFQFGRYLLVSSSRPGTMPANLQGVWTAHDKSPWGAGYWHNVNVQMNYWPAFTTGLAECFEAYAAFNEAFRPATRGLVERYLAEHDLGEMPSKEESPDIWIIGTSMYPYEVGEGPVRHSGPGQGGLTTKLFADWWDFTHDEKVLRRHVWPAIHGMADFYCRCVVETNGLFLSKFSASPEQYDYRAKVEKGKRRPFYQTLGCAFDQQMIWENNNDLLRLAAVLGTNDAVVARVRRQIGRYDPVQVGESGQIKEYREEKKYGEIGEYHHRHVSQLMGLYPGMLINSDHPDWMAAAKLTLDERGDKSTGWALAHRMLCRARLGDGDHALALLRTMMAERLYPNLWDVHPPFQIDGNFGATAAVAEMLLQSHQPDGKGGFVIDLLPALPAEWASNGSFRGLCARGRLVVDCEWKDGKPVAVTVRAPKGAKPDVRFAGKPVAYTLAQ